MELQAEDKIPSLRNVKKDYVDPFPTQVTLLAGIEWLEKTRIRGRRVTSWNVERLQLNRLEVRARNRCPGEESDHHETRLYSRIQWWGGRIVRSTIVYLDGDDYPGYRSRVVPNTAEVKIESLVQV